MGCVEVEAVKADEIRCTAPHPDLPGEPCNARLYDAVPESIEIRGELQRVPPGCLAIQCWRCHTRYLVCLRAA